MLELVIEGTVGVEEETEEEEAGGEGDEERDTPSETAREMSAAASRAAPAVAWHLLPHWPPTRPSADGAVPLIHRG